VVTLPRAVHLHNQPHGFLIVRLQNPNDHALDVSGMSYVLEVNGQPLLRGVSDDAVNVPSFGESMFELTGISTLFGFVRQLHALQEERTGNISYRPSGKLSLGNRPGSRPFSYEDTLLPPAASGGGT
jgi:LEA14-like dessication related protein